MNRVIFLDRDGVINEEKKDYVTRLEDFQLLPDVGDYLKKMQDLGYLLIVITNQSAVNRGLITHETLNEIHYVMKKKLSTYGVNISDIYYCPHRPDENCLCRKPRTKMFSLAIEKHDVDINKSWFIGDKDTDLEAGKTIGLRTIKIESNSSIEHAFYKIIAVN